MMRWRERREGPVDEENPYWVSFSDIMAALLVVFMLAAVVLMLQLVERQRQLQTLQERFETEFAQLEAAEQVRRDVLERIHATLVERGIDVQISENHSVLRISDAVIGFDTGAFEIAPAYQPAARQIGEVIAEVVTSGKAIEHLDTIFIEGHTDRRPLDRPQMKGNWGLSTFRAISLWEFWNEQLPQEKQLGALKNHQGEALFSVSGYAATRPADSTGTGETALRQNRRIDIRFTIRRPDRLEYEAVGQTLEGFTP
ncbi:MAG: flagellar motor protein MotB [Halothiobacillaceae bacterium]